MTSLSLVACLLAACASSAPPAPAPARAVERCSFEREPDKDTDGTAYVVSGAIDEPLSGAAALAHFAPRTLIEIHVSVWCH